MSPFSLQCIWGQAFVDDHCKFVMPNMWMRCSKCTETMLCIFQTLMSCAQNQRGNCLLLSFSVRFLLLGMNRLNRARTGDWMTIIAVIRRSCEWIQQSVGELLMLLQMLLLWFCRDPKSQRTYWAFTFPFPILVFIVCCSISYWWCGVLSYRWV